MHIPLYVGIFVEIMCINSAVFHSGLNVLTVQKHTVYCMLTQTHSSFGQIMLHFSACECCCCAVNQVEGCVSILQAAL